MANETDGEMGKVAPDVDDQGQQIARAFVAPDGTVTIPNGEAKLISVDIADVDLLLSFSDGTFVVIPNGALDAISETPPIVLFNDGTVPLGNLFKMVGVSSYAKAGSLRVVSGNIDAPKTVEEVDEERPSENSPTTTTIMLDSDSITAPAPLVKVGRGTAASASGQLTEASEAIVPPVVPHTSSYAGSQTSPVKTSVPLSIELTNDSGLSGSDKITNDASLTISDQALDTTRTYTVDGGGTNSSYTAPHTDGSHTVVVVDTDLAGNRAVGNLTFTFDKTAPEAPILSLALDSGSSNSDHVTNDAVLIFSDAAADVIRTFSVDGGASVSSYVAPNADGSHTVMVTDTDIAGNSAAGTITFMLDKTAPSAPVASLTVDSGTSGTDLLTNNAALNFSAAASDVTRSYVVDGNVAANSYQAPTADGSHAVVVTDTDVAGNSASGSITFTLDKTAPTVPTVSLTVDSGFSSTDMITNNASLAFSSAASDVTRTYSVDGNIAGSSYAAPTADGSHTVVVTDTDVAGNTATGGFAFTLDETAPPPPTLSLAIDSGLTSTDLITNSGILTVGGVEAGAVVEYSANGTSGWSSVVPVVAEGANTVFVRQTDIAGNVSGNGTLTFTYDTTIATPTVLLAVDSGSSSSDRITNTAAAVNISPAAEPVTREYSVDGGLWNSTYVSPGVEGNHIVNVRDTDAAGNSATGILSFELDTTAPLAPTVSLFTDSGSNTSDAITNVSTLNISRIESGAVVEYSTNGTTGWNSAVPFFSDGANTVFVRQTDVAGNISSSNGSLTFTLDRIIATPTVSLAVDSGSSGTDLITNNASLTFSSPAGDVSRLYAVDGGAAVSSYVAPNADGSHTVVVTDTDVAGNTATGNITFTLDKTAPNSPTIALSVDSGSNSTDLITNNAALIFSNPAAGITRAYSIDGGVTANSYSAPVTDGSHNVVVIDTDVAGNTASGTISFVLDRTIATPTAALLVDSGSNNSDLITNDGALTFSAAASDVTRAYSVDGAVAVGSYITPNVDGSHTVVVIDSDVAGNTASGTITFTLDRTVATPTASLVVDSGISSTDLLTNNAALTFSAAATEVTRTYAVDGGSASSSYIAPVIDGIHTVIVTDTDVAGNTASGTISFTLDTAAPAVPTATLATDSGSSSSDRITNNASLLFSTAATDVTRSYAVDGIAGGSYVVPNSDGSHTVIVTDTDVAGNASSGTITFTLDRTIAIPTVSLAVDSGTSSTDLITNNASLSISAAAGDVSRMYSVDGGTAVNSYVVPSADGSHTVVVTDTDVAGNTASGTITFTLDHTVATPTVSLLVDSGISSTDMISNSGSLAFSLAAADVSRTYSVDGAAAVSSYLAPNTDGNHTVVVTDSDVAGNTASGTITFTLDRTIATPIVSLVADNGLSDADLITNNASLTLSGAASDVTRMYALDGGSATSSYLPPGTDGVHTVVVTDSDVAGNTASGSITFTLDRTAPATPTVAVSVDSGSSSTDLLTNNAALTLSGAASDVTRTYAVDGGSGTSSYLAPGTDGVHTVVVTDTDVAGNSASGNITFTLDRTIATPTASLVIDSGTSNIDLITNNEGLLFSAAASDVTRSYSVDGAAEVSSYVAPSADGSHFVVVSDTDTAGNTATGGISFALDKTNPSTLSVSLASDSGSSSSDKITNVSTLSIAGIEGSATVEYSPDGISGWSSTAPVAVEGSNTVNIRQVDVAGNTSPNSSFTYTLDTTPPATPTVSLSLDTGLSNSDLNTKDARLTLSAAAADVTRTFSVNGGAAVSSYVAPTLDGVYTVLVSDSDLAGNTASGSITFTLDTTAPAAPAVSLATDSGLNTSDKITNVSGLAIAGIDTGAVVEYSPDGTSGWSTAAPVTVEGSNTVAVRQTDLAGNISSSTTLTYTLDTAAPAAPTVSLQNDSGSNINDKITNVATLNVGGLEAGALAEYSSTGISGWSTNAPAATEGSNTVFVRQTDAAGNNSAATVFTYMYDTTAAAPTISLVFDSGSSNSDKITNVAGLNVSGIELDAVVEYSANGTSGWSMVAPVTTEGVNTVFVRQTDVAGNISSSTSFVFTHDTTLPVAPSVSLVSDSGSSSSDKITNVSTLSIAGIEGSATVEYSPDGISGWSSTAPVAVEGSNTVNIRQVDVAGNTSPNSSFTYTLDTTPPATPLVALSSDTGMSNSDLNTKDSLLTFSASAADVTRTFSVNGGAAVSSYVAPTLDGVYTVLVSDTDLAGNTASGSITFTLDTTAPAAPAVSLATDSGLNTSDKITNVSGLAIAGIDTGAVVEYSPDGTSGWSTAAPVTVEGSNTVAVRQTDLAGNISSSTTLTYILDRVSPAAPTVSLQNDSGSNPNDKITNIATLNIGGLEVGALAEYSSTGISGWSTNAPAATEGSNTVFVRQTDAAGNNSAATVFTYMYDTTAAAPTISLVFDSGSSNSDKITNVAGLNVSGIELDAVVEYSANGTSGWSMVAPVATEGANTVFVRQTDVAGNTSSAKGLTFTLDTIVASPVITGISNDSGTVGDGITNDPTLVFSGSAETASNVTLFINGVSVGTALASGSSLWSFDYSGTPLSPGNYAVTAQATDVAGNSSPISGMYTITIENALPPTIETFNPITADDTINSAEVGSVVAIAGTVGGGAKEGDVVTLLVNGKTSTGLVQPGNFFSINVLGSDLAAGGDGAKAVNVSITSAGSTINAADEYTVDTIAPAPPTLQLTTDSGSSSVDKITSVADLTVGGVELGAVVEYSSTGTDGWSAAVPFLPQGDTTVFVRQTDIAGNVSSSRSITFTVDTSAPAAPMVELTTDSGSSTTDRISNVGTLTVSGLETAAGLEYSIDGGTVWSGGFTASEGTNSVQVRQIDIAGNVSNSSSLAFTLDTLAPAAPMVALASDSGSSNSDNKTNDNTLTVTGTEVGAIVEYSTNGIDGWSSTTPGSVEGNNIIYVRQADVAGNPSGASNLNFILDTLAPTPSITINPITGDNIIDKTEAGGNILVTGTVTGANVGDIVTLTLESTGFTGTYSGTVYADSTFSIDVAGFALLADVDTKIHGSVTTYDTAGNLGTATTALIYSIDTTPVPTITLAANITADDIINIAEELAGAPVVVTGTVGGDAREGDTVTLTVNNNDSYSGVVANDKSFSISVAVSDLVADADRTIEARVTMAGTGVPGTYALDTEGYSVDLVRPTATIVVADGSLTIGETSAVTITFSEAVTGFTNADLTVPNGTLTDVSSADGGKTWTAEFSPAVVADALNVITLADGTVTDLAGNANSGTTDSNNFAIDTTPPSFTQALYTSPFFKVILNGAAIPGAPLGAQDSSPAAQATREIINGTAGNDTIDHNSAFSADASQWAKILHFSFDRFTEITSVEIAADAAVSAIPGFDLKGVGVAGNDSNLDGKNDRWIVTPADSTALLGGLDVTIVYDATTTTDPSVDFNAVVTVSGKAGTTTFAPTNTLNFSWRDASTAADFSVLPVLVLPRGGVGVDYFAGAGNDVVNAGAGNDTLDGGAGADALHGGSGNDTASYAKAGAGIQASLTTLTGLVGDSAGDTYTNIENLTGSAYGDTLTGDASANILVGGGGNDTLEGRDGADSFDGGTGTDTAWYFNATASVAVSLTTGYAQSGEAAGDSFINVENLLGSAYDDIMIGNSGANVINGWGGNDTLEGLAGSDTLYGDTGTDTASYEHALSAVNASLTAGVGTLGDASGDSYNSIENLVGSAFSDTLTGNGVSNVLSGGTGNDILEGRDGADVLNGGDGSDTASYSAAGSGLRVSLFNPASNTGTDALGDSYSSIENLTGSFYTDVLVGDNSINTLTGGPSNDILEGMGGADTLDGGTGYDTASYESALTAISASLSTGVGTVGDASGDSFVSIENLTGGAGDDILEGNSLANLLNGGAGNDTVSYAHAGSAVLASIFAPGGNTGNATGDSYISIENLIGSNYNDTLTGNLEANVFSGGGGTDTVSYSYSASAISASLDTGVGTVGDASGDSYFSIENLTGGAVDDALIGDVNANILIGGAGADNLDGGAGNDVLIGGAGSDVLTGGAGIDTASYTTAAAAISASLATGGGTGGDAAGDTFYGIENLTGGVGNDILEGNNGANVLDGGAGNDTANYASSIFAIAASLTNASSNSGDAAGDSYVSIENLVGGFSNDALFGDSGINILTGGDGDDLLEGMGGSDILAGGSGTDTASYANAGQGVYATLVSGYADVQTGDAKGDIYTNIENLSGSNYDDILNGNEFNNTLTGGSGNDNLDGRGGADIMYGGSGNDTVYTNQGSDQAYGGDNNDTFYVSSLIANQPTVIDGGARDAGDGNTLVLQDLVSGGYNMSDLAGLNSRLVAIDTLNIRGDGASTALTISGQDIQYMVDNGASSQLLVKADNGDTLNVSLSGSETMVSTVIDGSHTDYAIFTDATHINQIAQIHWQTA